MHQAASGIGGGREARPGEMPFRAQQSGSGEDHRGRLDPWGEEGNPTCFQVITLWLLLCPLSGSPSCLFSGIDNVTSFVLY